MFGVESNCYLKFAGRRYLRVIPIYLQLKRLQRVQSIQRVQGIQRVQKVILVGLVLCMRAYTAQV